METNEAMLGSVLRCSYIRESPSALGAQGEGQGRFQTKGT